MATKPRTTKKPIPKRVAEWDNEIDGITKFLARAKPIIEKEPLGWLASICSYYRTRLRDLKNHPPRSRRVR